MMEYKGYIGNVEFDDEADIFHCEVINLRDSDSFCERQFHDSSRGVGATYAQRNGDLRIGAVHEFWLNGQSGSAPVLH